MNTGAGDRVPAAPGSPRVAAAPAGEDGPLPRAVLWDLDGTLIDSEPYWIAEEYALVARYGGTWSRKLAAQLVGASLLHSAEFIRANSPVSAEPLEIVQTMQAGVVRRLREKIPWRPGARELLAALSAAGVPSALVTMSWRAMADAVLDSLPGAFAASVSGDEVTNGKPHPEAYHLGARALGLQASSCIAIEDSVPGVAAALASGARTIAVPHEVPIPAQPRLARISTLAGVTPADLVRLTDAVR